jgi:hypothetical protein
VKGPKPKLTVEQAMQIRRAYTATDCTGAGMLVLAARYGVSTTLISSILTGKHTLTAGLPNVSGRRKTLQGDAGWGPGSNRITPGLLKDAGLSRSVRLTPEMRRKVPCPRCGARPGQSCTNPRVGSYPRPMQNLHRERRPATQEVPA